MFCKQCKKPIFHTTEGESLCADCWCGSQMSLVEKSRDSEIAHFIRQEAENKKFESRLNKAGIEPDFVDGFGCQIGEMWFDAEVYLGDLGKMDIEDIALELALNIKATFAELE